MRTTCAIASLPDACLLSLGWAEQCEGQQIWKNVISCSAHSSTFWPTPRCTSGAIALPTRPHPHNTPPSPILLPVVAFCPHLLRTFFYTPRLQLLAKVRRGLNNRPCRITNGEQMLNLWRLRFEVGRTSRLARCSRPGISDSLLLLVTALPNQFSNLPKRCDSPATGHIITSLVFMVSWWFVVEISTKKHKATMFQLI